MVNGYRRARPPAPYKQGRVHPYWVPRWLSRTGSVPRNKPIETYQTKRKTQRVNDLETLLLFFRFCNTRLDSTVSSRGKCLRFLGKATKLITAQPTKHFRAIFANLDAMVTSVRKTGYAWGAARPPVPPGKARWEALRSKGAFAAEEGGEEEEEVGGDAGTASGAHRVSDLSHDQRKAHRDVSALVPNFVSYSCCTHTGLSFLRR